MYERMHVMLSIVIDLLHVLCIESLLSESRIKQNWCLVFREFRFLDRIESFDLLTYAHEIKAPLVYQLHSITLDRGFFNMQCMSIYERILFVIK